MLERLQLGAVPRKHHIAFRSAEGALLHEECFTRDGFDGPYTILYHQHRPHAQHASVAKHGWTLPERAHGAQRLLKRHYRSQELTPAKGPQLNGRIPLLFNEDVVLSVLHPTEPDPVYLVNADGDDLFFIHEGGGVLRTVLGDVRFEKDDYVFVPKGLLHRFIPDSARQYWLSIELLGGLHIPKQFLNGLGQLRMDAPYCHRDFRRPVLGAPFDEGIREVVVKRAGAFHGLRQDTTPLDVVGWDGTVYPWAFPILNFQPRAGQVHLPPTLHGTFAGRGALVCSFVPRLVDFHPEAIPCPYPHSSVDVDEFIFYCRGNFTSRRGVGPGSISLHPAGLPHGPHPGAYEGSIGHKETTELAVMLDCLRPLHPTSAAAAVEDSGYQESFLA